jgi:hypothetical protein
MYEVVSTVFLVVARSQRVARGETGASHLVGLVVKAFPKRTPHTAEPTLIHRSLALLPLFVKMTALIREMAVHTGFEKPFSNASGLFSSRSKYAQIIHINNVIESSSILCLIHDNDFTMTADWLCEPFSI